MAWNYSRNTEQLNIFPNCGFLCVFSPRRPAPPPGQPSAAHSPRHKRIPWPAGTVWLPSLDRWGAGYCTLYPLFSSCQNVHPRLNPWCQQKQNKTSYKTQNTKHKQKTTKHTIIKHKTNKNTPSSMFCHSEILRPNFPSHWALTRAQHPPQKSTGAEPSPSTVVPSKCPWNCLTENAGGLCVIFIFTYDIPFRRYYSFKNCTKKMRCCEKWVSSTLFHVVTIPHKIYISKIAGKHPRQTRLMGSVPPPNSRPPSPPQPPPGLAPAIAQGWPNGFEIWPEVFPEYISYWIEKGIKTIDLRPRIYPEDDLLFLTVFVFRNKSCGNTHT